MEIINLKMSNPRSRFFIQRQKFTSSILFTINTLERLIGGLPCLPLPTRQTRVAVSFKAPGATRNDFTITRLFSANPVAHKLTVITSKLLLCLTYKQLTVDMAFLFIPLRHPTSSFKTKHTK